MMSKNIQVSEFSRFPGPRYEKLGDYSGETFRQSVLLPAIEQYGADITINLDGTMGYGSSFLEESFGGLIRSGVAPEVVKEILSKLQSSEDPSLILEIQEYVDDAIQKEG